MGHSELVPASCRAPWVGGATARAWVGAPGADGQPCGFESGGWHLAAVGPRAAPAVVMAATVCRAFAEGRVSRLLCPESPKQRSRVTESVTPFYGVGDWGLRELAQGHASPNSQSRDSNPPRPPPGPLLLTTAAASPKFTDAPA